MLFETLYFRDENVVPKVTETISGRMRHLLNLSLGCFTAPVASLFPLKMVMDLVFALDLQQGLAAHDVLLPCIISLPFLAMWFSVSPSYSCQDKQLGG